MKKIKIQKPKIYQKLESIDNVERMMINEELIEDCMIENTTIYDIYDVKVRLDGCIFKNVSFENCDFRKIDITDVIFENCDLSNINFSDSGIYRVQFKNCKLVGSKFMDCVLKSLEFDNCHCRYSNFSFSKLSGVSIKESDFLGSVFQEIKNETLLLEDVNLSEVSFTSTPLKNIDFTTCIIEGIDVRIEDVKDAMFTPMQALDLTKLMGIKVK